MGLSLADVKTICDSIAKQALDVNAAFTANKEGCTNNRATILAAQTEDDIKAGVDLSAAFSADVKATVGLLYESRRVALENHLNQSGGLSGFLKANDSRISYALRDILNWSLLGDAVFPPILGASVFGSFEMGGPSSGTDTPGTGLNKQLYGKTWIAAKVVSQAWVTDCTLDIEGLKWDGTQQNKQIAILDTAAIGTIVNIGVLGTAADNFAKVTRVFATGGSIGNKIEFESRLERVVVL